MCTTITIARGTRIRRDKQAGRLLATVNILDATTALVGFSNGGGTARVPIHELAFIHPEQLLPAERKTTLRKAR